MANEKSPAASFNLRNDENAISYLQDQYRVGKDEAEIILRDIDLFCEGLLELANKKEEGQDHSSY